MQRYKFTVSKVTYQTREVEVDATEWSEAIRLALAKARSLRFSGKDSDYMVGVVGPRGRRKSSSIKKEVP